MLDEMDNSLARRLQATSYALPVVERFRDIADEVYDLNTAGATEREITAHIKRWIDAEGFGFDTWREEIGQEFGELLKMFDLEKLYKAFGSEEWIQKCIRSVAFTDEPIPFHPWSMGFWYVDKNADPPLLVAVMTPLSDPELAARQVKEKHRETFGKTASKSQKDTEVENARMLAKKREGMSYREIAIQNLREQHPDIVSRPHKYRGKIATERERVIKAISAAEKLWKERGL